MSVTNIHGSLTMTVNDKIRDVPVLTAGFKKVF